MKKYFITQCKRIGRFMPGAFLVVLILLGGLATILGTVMQQEESRDENNKFQVGIVGTADDPFLQMGFSAMTQYDSTRLAMELVEMSEKDAAKALSMGKISAYVVIPEEFMDEAFHGNILPLKFVSSIGSTGMIAIFQAEITDTISRILLDAQKGVYGMDAAADDHGLSSKKQMSEMPLKYTEYVFLREHAVKVTDLGISDGLGFMGYLFCGFTVLFLLLSCLPFAPLMIRRDTALAQMLSARGRPAFLQTLFDYITYVLSLGIMLLGVVLVALLVKPDITSMAPVFSLILRGIPVVFMAAAFSYLLYCLATDLVGGILLQFFVTLGMCFVSGCLYPVSFFPAKVQKIATFLPTGVARSALSGAFTGERNPLATWLLLGYTASFFLLGSLLSYKRIKGVRK